MTTEASTEQPSILGIQRVIYELLQTEECSIRRLYATAFDVPYCNLPEQRFQQQRLGTYIARLNKKLDPRERVVPGVARGTYRLEKIAAAG